MSLLNFQAIKSHRKKNLGNIFNRALGRNGRMGSEDRRRGQQYFQTLVGREFQFWHDASNTITTAEDTF